MTFKPFQKGGRRLVAAAAPLVLLAACAVDLGSLGGDSASALGVNDAGVTVGSALTPDGVVHAFRREPGGPMVDISGGAGYSLARAVNDAGVAVGDADHRAVLWQPDGTMVELGLGPSSSAYDINDAGTVVGARGADAVVLAASGAVTVLPPAFAGVEGQIATAVNGEGDVAGTAGGPSGSPQAVLWEAPDYAPVVLSDRPGYDVRVDDVNDDGAVVATAWSRYTSVALVWRAGTHEEVELAGGPDDVFTQAHGITDDGTVVGSAAEFTGSTFVNRAVRWGPGIVADPVRLGGLGGGSSRALGVNDRGDAVGSAAVRERGSGGQAIYHAAFFPHDG